MSRSVRLFEIIQILRGARGPLTAESIAERLEVTKRTVYRDIAALQARRVPIEGEAGIGYVMRPGFDLPPLMFTEEEIEAISVGLALLERTSDGGLIEAAARASAKIADVLPEGVERRVPLHVSSCSEVPPSIVDMRAIRAAIREEQALALEYRDVNGSLTRRVVLPLAVTYHIQALVLRAWCELREDFRHFRVDRIESCALVGRDFRGRGACLRAAWETESRRRETTGDGEGTESARASRRSVDPTLP